MERHVVEHREDAVVHQVRDERRTRLEVGDLQVEHVRVVAAFRWDVGQLQVARVREALQVFAVGLPAGHAVVENLLRVLEFGVEVCRVELARQVARAQFHPGVLVHLAAVELHAVRALLADYFRVVGELLVFDEDGPAFAHAVVLCLVVAVAAEIPERA